MPTTYCTLEDAKYEILAETGDTLDEVIIKALIGWASSRVDLLLTETRKPIFAPSVDTKNLPLRSTWLRDSGVGYNPHFPILEVTSVLVNNTGDDLADDIEVDFNQQLRWIGTGAGFLELAYANGVSARLHIEGIWGFQKDYASAWLKYDDLQADIDPTASTLEVADAGGASPNGITPRFTFGQYLRIGTEFMQVVDVDTDTDMLTVLRGVNGSLAASHSTGADIEVWQIEEPIRHAVMRQVGLLYQRRSAYHTQTIDGFGTAQYPEDLLGELQKVVDSYKGILNA